jgi:hypothetical protein
MRPVTQHLLSISSDLQCAADAVSFDHDDGSAFEQDEPLVERVIGAMIPFRVEAPLSDGTLFCPHHLEHKWAIFHRGGRILFVRSWTRKLHVIAGLSPHEGRVEITRLNGVFTNEDESPLLTTMIADFCCAATCLAWSIPRRCRRAWSSRR